MPTHCIHRNRCPSDIHPMALLMIPPASLDDLDLDRDASLTIDYHDLTRDHPSTLPTLPYKKRLGHCLILVPCTVGHGLDRAFLSEKRYQPDARIRLAYLFSPPAIPGVKEPCRHIASTIIGIHPVLTRWHFSFKKRGSSPLYIPRYFSMV